MKLKNWLIEYDEYVGYHWEENTTPAKTVEYEAPNAAGALRKFKMDHPFYQINRLRVDNDKLKKL